MGLRGCLRLSAMLLVAFSACLSSDAWGAIGEIELATFRQEEGWRLEGEGDLGGSRLEGNRLHADLPGSQRSLILRGSFSLPPNARSLHINAAGSLLLRFLLDSEKVPAGPRGLPARLGTTHTAGLPGRKGDASMRLTGIEIVFPEDSEGPFDLELQPIRVSVEYDREFPVLLETESHGLPNGGARFVLIGRSLTGNALCIDVDAQVLDFGRDVLGSASGVLDLPARGRPERFILETNNVDSPPFLEGKFHVLCENEKRTVAGAFWREPSPIHPGFSEWFEEISPLRVPGLEVRPLAGHLVRIYAGSRHHASDASFAWLWNAEMDHPTGPPLEKGLPTGPAYTALHSAFGVLRGASSTRSLSHPIPLTEINHYEFLKDGRQILAMCPVHHRSALRLSSSGPITIIDVMGAEEILDLKETGGFLQAKAHQPFFLISEKGATIESDHSMAATNGQVFKPGQTVSVSCFSKAGGAFQDQPFKPLHPEGWRVVGRSVEILVDSFRRVFELFIPPGTPSGNYPIGCVFEADGATFEVSTTVTVE